MALLKHPNNNNSECNDTKSKLSALHTFYSDLYTEERIDINSLDVMLNQINTVISKQNNDNMIKKLVLMMTLFKISREVQEALVLY